MLRRAVIFRLLTILYCVFALMPAYGKEQVAYREILELPFIEAQKWMSYGDDPLQKIGVWPAAQHSEAHETALVFIHGGCWLNAFDYHHAKGMYSALASQGIDVYVISYRRTGDEGGGWPGTFNDITNALSHLSTYWQKTTIPMKKVLAGHSAGGHLALLAGQQNQAKIPAFDKVIGLAAITDVATYAVGENSCQTATPAFFDGTPAEKAGDYADATPHLTENAGRFVTLHGDQDNIVPVKHAFLTNATSIVVNGGGHFDWLHPETPSFRQFLTIIKEE